MNESFVRLEGNAPGPVSIIIAGIHGDERCGIEALERVLPTLRIESGIVFAGYGNPRAIERNVRFTDANLNRLFKDEELLSVADKKSYEYGRMQYIKSFLDQSDALLDIHASFTPESQPFVICEPNGYALATHLPFPLIVSGFDNVEPGGTDYYMNKTGKIGLSAECGFLGDPHATHVAEETITAFLSARGHITPTKPSSTNNQKFVEMYLLYMTQSDSFVLARPFADFEDIKEGELIGTDGTTQIRAERTSVILFAGDRDTAGEEAFLLGIKKDSRTS